MTDARERVVFDCNVCFQAFISADGPAGRLLRAVHDCFNALPRLRVGLVRYTNPTRKRGIEGDLN
jgi:hypothetical protein